MLLAKPGNAPLNVMVSSLAAKWLIAPSLRIGHQWRDTAARSGGLALNVRLKTVKALAIETAEEDGSRAVNLLTPIRGVMLVSRLLRDIKASEAYLGSFGLRPELAETVYRTIQDLRLAGVTPEAIDPSQYETPEKLREIRRILTAYEVELHDAKLSDYADVLIRATSFVRNHPSPFGDVQILLPADLDCVALEQDFLDALPAENRIILPINEPGVPVEQSVPLTDAYRLRWLSIPDQAPPRQQDGSGNLFQAVGEVNEVREVFRRCVEQGWPLDTVEFLHTDYESYVPLVFETVQSLQQDPVGNLASLPVTFEEGIPVRYSRPGRALSKWVQWISEGFPQSLLVHMLRDGLLKVPSDDGEERLTTSRLARLLSGVRIIAGLDRYTPIIQAKIKELEHRLEEDFAEDEADTELSRKERLTHQNIKDYSALKSFVDGLVRVLGKTRSREKWTDADVLLMADKFLEHYAPRASEFDNMSLEILREHIAMVADALDDSDGHVSSNILEWLATLPKKLRVGGSGPRPGCIHVAHYLSGGHSSRAHTFVVGLDDRRFPGTRGQDPLLLDDERQKLAPGRLRQASEEVEYRRQRFEQLLARLSGTITLSYSCRDIVNDQDLFPSSVILSAYHLLYDNPRPTLDALNKDVGPAVSFTPSNEKKCLNENEWWLWRILEAGPTPDILAMLDARFPHLVQGMNASKARESSQFTEYDGFVSTPADIDRPFAENGPVLSASRLETLGKCPLGYFLQYVLKIEPPESMDLDEDRWLNAGDAGQLLHSVFRRCMMEIIQAGRLPEVERDESRAIEILDELVAEYKKEIPPPNEAVFNAQYQDFVATVQTFLRSEAIHCQKTTPLHCEVAIGMPSEDGGTMLDRSEPMQIKLAGENAIRVRGKIDRIDRIGNPDSQSFALWDYKTGSTYGYKLDDPFKDGRRIQNALYTHVAELLLAQQPDFNQPTVNQFGYIFPNRKAQGERFVWRRDELDDGKSILDQLCRIAEGGAFLATNDANDCSYCDYLEVCGSKETIEESSRLKLENLDNNVLEPFRKLRCTDDD